MSNTIEGPFVVTVKVTLITPLLATSPADTNLYHTFMIQKARDAGEEISPKQEALELESVQNVDGRGSTKFPRLLDAPDTPGMWPYQWKGFLKEKAAFDRYKDVPTISRNVRAYKKIIDGNVHITPQFIPLIIPDGAEMAIVIPTEVGDVAISDDRDISHVVRASTAQGPRIALTCSEAVPAGTTAEFEIISLSGTVRLIGSTKKTPKSERMIDWLVWLLAQGRLHGMGQWRNNSQFGRFTCELSNMRPYHVPLPIIT